MMKVFCICISIRASGVEEIYRAADYVIVAFSSFFSDSEASGILT